MVYSLGTKQNLDLLAYCMQSQSNDTSGSKKSTVFTEENQVNRTNREKKKRKANKAVSVLKSEIFCKAKNFRIEKGSFFQRLKCKNKAKTYRELEISKYSPHTIVQ